MIFFNLWALRAVSRDITKHINLVNMKFFFFPRLKTPHLGPREKSLCASLPGNGPKGVFGKGVGNSKNASEMRQNGSCFIGKRGTFQKASKLHQKCVKNARNTFGGEHLLDDTDHYLGKKQKRDPHQLFREELFRAQKGGPKRAILGHTMFSLFYSSGTKKEPKPKLLSPDIFW